MPKVVVARIREGQDPRNWYTLAMPNYEAATEYVARQKKSDSDAGRDPGEYIVQEGQYAIARGTYSHEFITTEEGRTFFPTKGDAVLAAMAFTSIMALAVMRGVLDNWIPLEIVFVNPNFYPEFEGSELQELDLGLDDEPPF